MARHEETTGVTVCNTHPTECLTTIQSPGSGQYFQLHGACNVLV